MLTLEEFDKIKPGEVFRMGIISNSPTGVFMTDAGGMLRFVAKKGYANDWTVYIHWATSSWDFIEKSGDKSFTETYIRRCVPCTDEVFKLYRR